MGRTGFSSALDVKKRFKKHLKIVSSPKVKLLKVVSSEVSSDLKATAEVSLNNLCGAL